VLLATAGFAAAARARSLARETVGSDADATATERARLARARAAPAMLADVKEEEEPAAPARSDPWDKRNPYERWVRNVPFESTRDIR